MANARRGGAAFIAGVLVVLAISSASPPARALSVEQRAMLDLDAYTVRDPDRGYFDVDERRRYLATTDSPVLRAAIEAVAAAAPACVAARRIPKIDFRLRMPAYYTEPEAWREAIKPIFAFEDMMSTLAGAFVALGDPYHGRCLIEVLHEWATADALSDFHYEESDRQAWYNVEDMLFSAALAYSVVRKRIPGTAPMERRIDAWLRRISHNHIRIRGGTDSCCNNHFYRRALHATTVGILTDDDELFRFGVSAIYSAISEITENGTLPREYKRGRLAIHYQNYATLYLVFIAQLIERQGYDIFNLEIAGHRLADVVDRAVGMMRSPESVVIEGVQEQNLHFMDDRQYFAWMEVWLSRFDDPEIEANAARFRPIFNRSAGGFTTLYFYRPDRGDRESAKPSQD